MSPKQDLGRLRELPVWAVAYDAWPAGREAEVRVVTDHLTWEQARVLACELDGTAVAADGDQDAEPRECYIVQMDEPAPDDPSSFYFRMAMLELIWRYRTRGGPRSLRHLPARVRPHRPARRPDIDH